eukprot:PhF_6_TR14180/c0_g1_i1/m.22703/K19362/TMEM231; transmembrane protein 231
MRRIIDKQVHRHRYVSSLCSIILLLVGYIGIPVASYFIAFFIGGFWIQESTFHTQPAITLTNTVLAVMDRDTMLGGWSDVPALQKYFGEKYIVPRLDVYGEDHNGDKRVDTFFVHVRVAQDALGTTTLKRNNLTNNNIPKRRAELLLGLRFQSDGEVPVDINSAILVTWEVDNGKTVIDGDITFQQKQLLIQ